MNLIDYVIIAIVVVILGAVVFYLRKKKKKGVKCIGCPEDCSGDCGCCGKGK